VGQDELETEQDRASERGEAWTEDLRHSVRHCRALFVELLELPGDEDASPREGELEEVRAHDNNVERLR